jgi:hypothetical protein
MNRRNVQHEYEESRGKPQGIATLSNRQYAVIQAVFPCWFYILLWGLGKVSMYVTSKRLRFAKTQFW